LTGSFSQRLVTRDENRKTRVITIKLVMNEMGRKNSEIAERINHPDIAPPKANSNRIREDKAAYPKRNNPLKAIDKGTISAAIAAAFGPNVIPMKSSEMAAVEGKPPITPPIVLPRRSVITVMAAMKTAPTRKLAIV
jgi:hypothetical protein